MAFNRNCGWICDEGMNACSCWFPTISPQVIAVMPTSPAQDINTEPLGTTRDPIVLASALEIHRPSLEPVTLLPAIKSGVVIQGMSPSKCFGLFLPGTMKPHTSPTRHTDHSSGIIPTSVCL